MKKIIGLLVFGLLISSGIAAAGDDMHTVPYKGSLELQQMKAFAGTWKGTQQKGKEKPEPVEVTYEIKSNGNVVVETLFPGTPHEMISVYYDSGGLMMTHYCALGNRPQMKLVSVAGTFEFVMVPNSGIDPNAMHMHSLYIKIIAGDHIVHDWVLFDKGKEIGRSVFDLTRVPAKKK